jgi:MFS transporter, MHS family, shikimate and dehydroshikimate transport protein
LRAAWRVEKLAVKGANSEMPIAASRALAELDLKGAWPMADGATKSGSSAALIFLATAVGSTFEQYDFLLYGMCSALFFNKLFFPSFSPAAGALAAISVYAVGYCARPLGGIICGHFGDRIGRKSMLLVTFLVMGSTTVFIGCLPVYDDVGIAAPIALVALRFIQGLAIGGEHSGSGVFAVENAPPNRRGFYGTWPAMGISAGALLATSALGLAEAASGDAFLKWGWRLPFMASAVLLLLGMILRKNLQESPAFRKVVKTQTVEKLPLLTVLRGYRRTTVIVTICRTAEIAWEMLLTIIGATYITGTLGLPRSVYLHAIEIAAVFTIAALWICGRLMDRFGRRKLYIYGALMAALMAFPFFKLLDARQASLITLAIILGEVFGHAPMIGTQQSFFSELYPSRVRFTGVALGQQIGAALGGGLLLLGFASLLTWSNGDATLTAICMATVALIAVVAAALAPETLGRNLDSIGPEAGSDVVVGEAALSASPNLKPSIAD